MKLRQIRQEKGLTQTQLGHKIKMAGSCVSQVESGDRRAWPNFRKRVARALGTPEAEIFGND